jgi:hypothetical protein
MCLDLHPKIRIRKDSEAQQFIGYAVKKLVFDYQSLTVKSIFFPQIWTKGSNYASQMPTEDESYDKALHFFTLCRDAMDFKRFCYSRFPPKTSMDSQTAFAVISCWVEPSNLSERGLSVISSGFPMDKPSFTARQCYWNGSILVMHKKMIRWRDIRDVERIVALARTKPDNLTLSEMEQRDLL